MKVSSKKKIAMILLLLLSLVYSCNIVFASDQMTGTGAGGSMKQPNSSSDPGSMFNVELKNGQPTISGLGTTEANQKKVIDSFKKLAGTIGAIALPIYVIIFVTLFVKISAEGNPNKRKELVKQAIVVFIAIGLTALAGFIVVVAFKFF